MTEYWRTDRRLKLWMLAVVVLGGGAFAAELMVSKFETEFVTAGVPGLTYAILASVDAIWLLPVLALGGYLLRRRQVGTGKVHAAGAMGLLVIGGAWLVIAIGALFWLVLGLR